MMKVVRRLLDAGGTICIPIDLVMGSRRTVYANVAVQDKTARKGQINCLRITIRAVFMLSSSHTASPAFKPANNVNHLSIIGSI